MAENVTVTQAQPAPDPEIDLIVENVSENESTNTTSSTKEVKLKKKLSFKNLKSNVMKKLKATDQVGPDPPPSPVPSDTSEKSKKGRKKARSASFMKRLTSGKVGPGKGKPDESPDTLKRGSPEGGNLSGSETSLCEIEETDEKLKAELFPNDGQLEKDDDSVLTHSNEITSKASPTEDIQLQSDANANANKNELTSKDDGASIGEVVSSIILEGKEKSKRKSDESKKKTLSLPRLGKALTPNSNSSKFSVSKTTETGIVKPLIKAFEGDSKGKREKSSSPKKERKVSPKKEKSVKSATLKGNKKKSEKTSIPVEIPKIDAEGKQEDDYMSAQESPEIIEPKIVITTVRVQEANIPYQLGNSLKNPNLSSFKKPEDESGVATEAKKDEIIFDIGTQVRAGRTSSFSTSRELLRPDSPRTEDFTSLDTKASIDSSLGEGVRRRIAYVAQPTLLTADEEELLSKTQSARDKNPSILDSSAVSDFTLDSTDYLESRMAPHGDLLDESKVSLVRI